jgi:hypothetical protein
VTWRTEGRAEQEFVTSPRLTPRKGMRRLGVQMTRIGLIRTFDTSPVINPVEVKMGLSQQIAINSSPNNKENRVIYQRLDNECTMWDCLCSQGLKRSEPVFGALISTDVS